MRDAIQRRTEVDASGEIVELASSCPWKEHMHGLEMKLRLERPIKFCIYEVRCHAASNMLESTEAIAWKAVVVSHMSVY